MVYLIDDNIVVVVVGQLQVIDVAVHDVFAGEECLIAVGCVAVIPHVAEVVVVQHEAERLQTLLENLLPMGDEQQTRAAVGFFETLIVEGRDDSLTGSGGSHHEVLEVVVHLALYAQPLQHVALIVLGFDEVEFTVVDGCLAVLVKCLLQPFVVDAGAVGLEVLALPIAVEGVGHLMQDVGQFHLRHLEVPLQSGSQCGTAHVGAADISGMKSGIPQEDIRFGVQPVVIVVVRNLHLGVLQHCQAFHGLEFRCLRIG